MSNSRRSKPRSGTGTHTEVPLEDLNKDWLHVFQQFKPDKNGEVRLSEMRRYLTSPEIQHEIPSDAVDVLLARFDRDENGKLSYMEFLDMVSGLVWEVLGIDVVLANEYHLEHRPIIRKALWAAAYQIVPRKERENWSRRYLDEYSCCPPPIFMFLISLIELGIFIYHTIHLIKDKGWVGINGPAPITSVLIYDPYRRYEAWRFISYMFVHSGFMHVTFNILIQLFLGIPLEMVHGWWRVLLCYFAGVVAGSLGTSITDPATYLAGASGGVYALMCAHLASIIMNWAEMEFAWLRLLFFGILTTADVGTAIYYRYVEKLDTRVGYVAHFAGAIAGLLVGIKVLRNLEKLKWEKVLWWICLALYIILMLVGIAWNIFYPEHFPDPKYD